MRRNIEEAFLPGLKRIGWATRSLELFEAELHSYYQTEFYKAFVEEGEAGEFVLKVTTAQLPDPAEQYLSQAIEHAKHALDQVVWASREITAGHDVARSNFPWAKNPKDLKETMAQIGKKNTQPNIPVAFHDIFEAAEPYFRGAEWEGGQDEIRRLAKVVNQKHSIGVAVGGALVQTKLPPFELTGGEIKFLYRRPNWDPETRSAEVVRWKGGRFVDSKASFVFHALCYDDAFAEPVKIFGLAADFIHWAEWIATQLKQRAYELPC